MKNLDILKRGKNFSEVSIISEPTLLTNNDLFDSFISKDKGFVIGSAIFLNGTSGAGKTTTMINIMKWLSPHITSLYSREMKSHHVKHQLKKLNMDEVKSAFISDKSTCPYFDDYMEYINEIKPKFIVIDSLQVIVNEDFVESNKMTKDAAAIYVLNQLREWVSKNNAALILIGHNTKDGDFEGKNTIKQLMDVHLEMVYDKNKNERYISASKNRKGDVGEKLFYEINENCEIIFMKEDVWKIKSKNISYLDYMWEANKIYVYSYKDHPKFKDFIKKYKSECDELLDVFFNESELLSEVVKLSNTLINLYFKK